MTKYLVTGGCGFIGSHLCEAMVAAGARVRVLDDLSSGRRENVPAGISVVVGDVADLGLVREVMAGVDACVHLAANASVEQSSRDWLGTHRTNLTGAICVFEAARRAAVPVIYASSAAVYGNAAELPIGEAQMPRPRSAYGADKLGCELHAAVASAVHGVPTLGLRFFNVYGPRQDPASPYSGVISIFCDRLLCGDPVAIFGDGKQTRDFIFVGDVVAALMRALERRWAAGTVVNVCTGRPTSIANLADTIAGLCGTSLRVRSMPARAGDVRDSWGDPTLMRKVLGTSEPTPLCDGVARVLEWARNGDR